MNVRDWRYASWLSPLFILTLLVIAIAYSAFSQSDHKRGNPPEQVLAIDFAKEYQQIDHFGASDAWSIDPAIKKWLKESKEEQVEALADFLFSPSKGIGLSAWRFNIGAGSFEQGSDSQITDPFRRAELLISEPGGKVDSGKQLGQIRFLQEAYERGVSNFVVFANSPPTWATKNGLAHPGNADSRSEVKSTNLKADAVDAYTEFLVDVVHYLRSDHVGVPVNFLSPVNEPSWQWESQSQEANRYNTDDLKLVYLSLQRELTKANLHRLVQIDAAEIVEYSAALSDTSKIGFDGTVFGSGMNNLGYGVYKNYIDELLGSAQLRELMGNHLSMHGYFSDADLNRMGELRSLVWQEVQKVSPGAKIWMSEYSILGKAGDARPFEGAGFATDDMEYALHVGKVIHRDLTWLNASAWHWWLALTPYDYKDGLLKVNANLDSDSLQPSKVMWVLGHFSRFIRPGYRRVELPDADDLDGLMASAYKAGDNKTLVVVAVNASDAAKKIKLKVSNLPAGAVAGRFSTYITNAENNLNSFETKRSFYLVPERSIVTIVAEIYDASGL